ncbi:MAG: MrpF/PhaF family protein, partial [Pseudomonadota bacterium]|nr:MrpF/PhaF family protein [Pseudomonadota bacterium]
LLLTLLRAALGPTCFDRALAVSSFGTQIILLIALYAFYTQQTDFLDIALLYALLGWIGTLALLKFIHHGDLGRESEETES